MMKMNGVVVMMGLASGAAAMGLALGSAGRPPAVSEPGGIAFGPAGPAVAVGPMAHAPALADLDGDGDLDAVVACGPCCGHDTDPDSGHVLVLRNDGRGVLSPAGARIRTGPTALGCAIGDVDGDKLADIVVYHHSSYEIAIVRGLGGMRFGEPSMVTMYDGSSPHVHALALADVNHDGTLDILATLVDDHAVAVLLGDGAGGFERALGQPYFAHRHPYAQLNVTDINGDTHADLVLTDVRDSGLTVMVGSGTGMFAASRGFLLEPHTPLLSAERPLGCALGDVDGDGDLDAVAFIDESPRAVLMVNAGRGEFAEAASGALIELGVASTGGTLADVTGDGVLDIVANGTQTRRISVNPGLGGGRFGGAVAIDGGGDSPGVSVGDMNGDGALDIVTGCYGSGTVSVLLAR